MVSLDTGLVEPGAQEIYWRNGLSELLDLEASIDPDNSQLFSKRLTAHELGYLSIVEVEGPAHRTEVRPRHPHDARHAAVMVWLQEHGSGSIVQDGVRGPLETSSVLLIDASHPRSLVHSQPYGATIIHVPFEPLRQALNGWQVALPLWFDATQGLGAVFSDYIRSVMRRCDESTGRVANALADTATRLLALALTALPDHAKALPAQLAHFHKARIRAFVAAQLRDPELDIGRVSAAVGLSRRYIHQLYASEPQPLMKWVWSERLEGAHADLQRPVMRQHAVSEIAFSWGFSDPAHFSRSFRRRFGTSPMAVRRDVASRASTEPDRRVVAQPAPLHSRKQGT